MLTEKSTSNAYHTSPYLHSMWGHFMPQQYNVHCMCALCSMTQSWTSSFFFPITFPFVFTILMREKLLLNRWKRQGRVAWTIYFDTMIVIDSLTLDDPTQMRNTHTQVTVSCTLTAQLLVFMQLYYIHICFVSCAGVTLLDYRSSLRSLENTTMWCAGVTVIVEQTRKWFYPF